VGQSRDQPRKLTVNAIALSDVDVDRAVAEGRLRHDLYYRLARVALWLPPLRERLDDIGPAAVWMGNRILAAAHIPLELRTTEDLRTASQDERRRAIELDASAIEALRAHPGRGTSASWRPRSSGPSCWCARGRSCTPTTSARRSRLRRPSAS
jgi:DNA-binding NtrC family response regulator